MRYLAHIAIIKGEPAWSGFDACGDFAQHGTPAFIIDVGRAFTLTRTGPERLYLLGNGPAQFKEFSPAELILAARTGMFRFEIDFEAERDSRLADKARRSRPKDRRQRPPAPSQARG